MIQNSMFQGRDICIGVCCLFSIVWCTGKVIDFVWVASVLCIACLAVSAIHSVLSAFFLGVMVSARAFGDTSICQDGQKVGWQRWSGLSNKHGRWDEEHVVALEDIVCRLSPIFY